MPRKALTAEQYTSGIEELTPSAIVRYGNRIVPSPIALAILSKKAGKPDDELLDRNIIIQKCRRGQLRPMGRYGKRTLYFWRRDIEHAPVREERHENQAS